MVMTVFEVYNNGNKTMVRVVNDETQQILDITPYQLLVGIELNGAVVDNVKTALNSVTIDICGNIYRIPVKLPENIKSAIRAKKEDERVQKNRKRNAEYKKKAEINKIVSDYREREEKRKAEMREISKGFARPGQLTQEERLRRRQEYYGMKH